MHDNGVKETAVVFIDPPDFLCVFAGLFILLLFGGPAVG